MGTHILAFISSEQKFWCNFFKNIPFRDLGAEILVTCRDLCIDIYIFVYTHTYIQKYRYKCIHTSAWATVGSGGMRLDNFVTQRFSALGLPAISARYITPHLKFWTASTLWKLCNPCSFLKKAKNKKKKGHIFFKWPQNYVRIHPAQVKLHQCETVDNQMENK